MLCSAAGHQSGRARGPEEFHGRRPDAAARHVLGRCVLTGLHLRVGYHAVHHGIDRNPAAGHGSASLPEDAARGRERTDEAEPVHTLSDSADPGSAGSRLPDEPEVSGAGCRRSCRAGHDVHHLHDDRDGRRLHVHHVAGRAHRPEGRGQRYLVHNPHRYHSTPPRRHSCRSSQDAS